MESPVLIRNLEDHVIGFYRVALFSINRGNFACFLVPPLPIPFS